MTTSTDSSPRCVVDALRGERETRPKADVTSAAGVRSILEDGIYAILGQARPVSTLVIRASSLRQHATVADISLAPLSRVRGILVNQVLRLLSIGARVTSPFDEALSAWRLEVGASELLDFVDRLDADERARLETDVTAHAITLMRSLGSVPPRWLPRTAVRASQQLGAGAVLLRDVVDLMVGTTSGEVANVVLFDVTTSPLGEGAERAMRYHALVQTLRTSVVPLRTSSFSTATGEMWSLDVDSQTLVRSAHDVLDAIERLWRAQ
ncbi:MAG: hypothetical protein ACYC19_03870 [Acidimicrobiales bacterium]